jgi:hypothetical protein
MTVRGGAWLGAKLYKEGHVLTIFSESGSGMTSAVPVGVCVLSSGSIVKLHVVRLNWFNDAYWCVGCSREADLDS